jgi:hypothetical protein
MPRAKQLPRIHGRTVDLRRRDLLAALLAFGCAGALAAMIGRRRR